VGSERKLTRTDGRMVRHVPIAIPRSGRSTTVEIRSHKAIGLVAWFNDDGVWRIWLAGNEAERVK
jgi:hypothetical protein